MNRSLVAALALALTPLLAAANNDIGLAFTPSAAAAKHVDIGDERALDAIRAANPAQYEKLIGILSLASDVSCETLPQMLKVQFNAHDVKCSSAAILTSFPAKRHVAFKLDETSFAGNVVLTGGTRARIVPAKPEASKRTPGSP